MWWNILGYRCKNPNSLCEVDEKVAMHRHQNGMWYQQGHLSHSSHHHQKKWVMGELHSFHCKNIFCEGIVDVVDVIDEINERDEVIVRFFVFRKCWVKESMTYRLTNDFYAILLLLHQHHHHPHKCCMPSPKQMYLIQAKINSKTIWFHWHFAMLVF